MKKTLLLVAIALLSVAANGQTYDGGGADAGDRAVERAYERAQRSDAAAREALDRAVRNNNLLAQRALNKKAYRAQVQSEQDWEHYYEAKERNDARKARQNKERNSDRSTRSYGRH